MTAYYRVVIILGQGYSKGQWNKIEIPKIDLLIQNYLIYGRGGIEDSRERTLLSKLF